jgi:hypothetical protein
MDLHPQLKVNREMDILLSRVEVQVGVHLQILSVCGYKQFGSYVGTERALTQENFHH